jgi:UDP-N-acetylmuramate--alanine ligase
MRENAKKVFALANLLGLDKEKVRLSLENFEGTWRRFEMKGEMENGAIVYDDYGHHPTEIRATLSAMREKFPSREITVIFQPHLYSRTKALLPDFASSFVSADKVVLAPIYAARESFDASVSSEILSRMIAENGILSETFSSFADIEKYIKTHTDKNSVVLTLGAGDVYLIGESLIIKNKL